MNTAPITETSARASFFGWFVRGRNRKRRKTARAEDETVISSYCAGTKLVERYYDEDGQLAQRETEDSPSCPV